MADPNMKVSDTTASFTDPARVTLVPKSTSPMGMWQTVGSGTAVSMELTCALGSVLDIELEYILNDISASGIVMAGKTITGATAGAVFIPQLNDTGSITWEPSASYKSY